MSNNFETKINQLLQQQPKNVVYTSSWMVQNGYSLELQRTYRNSKWFQSIGEGAMVRSGEIVNYLGALYALQKQLGMAVHLGGKTALEFQGLLHYLNFSQTEVTLFGGSGVRLPTWFEKGQWKTPISYQTSNFLPAKASLISWQATGFEVLISSPIRAFLELLLLLKESAEYVPIYEILLGMNNLHPKDVQAILEVCSSVKVKRLFLFMAEKTGHSWFNYLNIEDMELGRGKRSLVNEGVYDYKYKITVPKDLMLYE
ncbi:MAG: hypothetical protein GX801_11405 [Fibrobacter sp.]|nr:hypothetical protein [Fibrobacter sp.]